MPDRNDTFLGRARDRLQKLAADIAQLEAQEEGVRRRRLELVDQVRDWERAVSLYSEAMDVETTDAAPGQMSVALDAPSGTFAQLVSKYMGDHGGQAKIADIARWLVDVGRLPNDPKKHGQYYGRVYTTLLRHPDRYEFVDKGLFRLKDEGPGNGPGIFEADG